jgi:hypothetical protein
MFSRVATESPDSVALTYEDEQITYRELDRRIGRARREDEGTYEAQESCVLILFILGCDRMTRSVCA